MTKYAGKVGFVKLEKTKYDTFEEVVTEVSLTGDILQSGFNYKIRPYETDEPIPNVRVSLKSTSYLQSNLQYMRYLILDGSPYKIETLSNQRPRVVVTLGGVYNGNRPSNP